MKRIVFVILTTLALSVGIASATSTGCDSGKACVWSGSNYNGTRLEFGRGFANNRWSGFAMVGGAHSAKNRLGQNYGFDIADGPPGNRHWSDCIGNNSQRPSPNGTIYYVRVNPHGC